MWNRKKRLEGDSLREAVRQAIYTEKDAMDFYLAASQRMFNQKAKLTLKLLASEEREHALAFYEIYPGNDLPTFERMMAEPPDPTADWWPLIKQTDLGAFDEERALSLALQREEGLEIRLRELAGEIDDPRVREIYLQNAESTREHIAVIREDYANLLAASKRSPVGP